MEKVYTYDMKYRLKDGTIKTCKQKVKRLITGGLKTGRKPTIISAEIIDNVLLLKSRGKSYRKIASETGISVYHISKIINSLNRNN